MKGILGFILLALGVAGLLVGGHVASGGNAVGWVGVVGGIGVTVLAYLLMRPPGDSPAPER